MIIKNVGKPDRVVRVVVGLALFYGAYSSGGAASIVLVIAGLIALITGLVGWCGMYSLLGINTCKIDNP